MDKSVTKYSYDALGNLVGVTQNAQPGAIGGQQTRSYSYDGLSRLVLESNPESGRTKYIYDTTTGPCFGTSAGDLAESIDNSGAHICFYYDDLHRVFQKYTATSSGVISDCRNFNYGDYNVIPPTGITATNGNGRIVNANVQPDCQTAYSVDEWFSYDADGRVTDVWESTPHSGGYYHTTEGYWANNAIQSLGGIPGYTTITYGVDGEGRPSTAQQGTTKIVCDSSCSPSSTTFYPSGSPHAVNIGGTSDNDTYNYDPNTGRMSTYTFTVGATPTSTSGGLSWNQNGTLRQLAITDGFNTGGMQTCNFGTSTVMGYDDLGRLLSANCGSLWSQSFSYDPYGNITKTGSISWACAICYNGNNQYNTAISSLISYDADGRLLDDSFHKYTWDGYGNLASITGPNATITCGTTGTCLTYDPFGRMVEKNVSGTYTEIVYSPAGKTAIMQGQTTTQAYLPLPAGETLFASGPTGTNRFFWHKDWLGTVRLSSAVAGRTIAYDRAFAPFGERYANFGGTINPDFTGDTADTMSDLFDTQNREYHATQGRWISPDPAGLQGVDLSNPQFWNRYSYVINNPLTGIDPQGLFCVWDNGSFDSNDDPETGTQAACEGNGSHGGGTWFNGSPSDWVDSSGNQVFNSNDWSGGQNAEAAALAQAINPSIGDFGEPSSIPDASVSATRTLVPLDYGPIFCQPDVISAMGRIWAQSSNGSSGSEASFRLDGFSANYSIIFSPFTNQHNSQSVTIIPGQTFALFHVHPNTGTWQPSTPGNNYENNRLGDTGIADRFNLQMYVVSRQGLGFYNPMTRAPETLVRQGLSRDTPCR